MECGMVTGALQKPRCFFTCSARCLSEMIKLARCAILAKLWVDLGAFFLFCFV